jgi:hypothetical protein
VHRNPHKIDKEATRAAGFLSRYSYISLRIHPGTDHQCRYLAGDDVVVARKACFERDHYRCTEPNCGRCVSWETGEMDHGGKTKVQRCSCPENLHTKCGRCHRKKHNREVKLRDLLAEQGKPRKCTKHPKAVWFEGYLTGCPSCKLEAENEFNRLTEGM